MNAASGYSVLHDKEKCRECAQCETVCNFGSIQFLKDTDSLNGKRVYNKNTCMGCELCVEECPEGALSIYTDFGKPLPLDLDMVKDMSVVTK
ncbi:MAG: 4Fe-4S binding protein [Deltaproteobacteria bacterium]|nr:4Fe-4S binding protein [Deltaproteobacteria bacterium]